MSSRSLNEILIKSSTELFDLVFAAYNLSFISPRVVCLRLYAKGRCTRCQQRALFTILYLWFKHCAKDVSTFTAQPTILEYLIFFSHTFISRYIQNFVQGTCLKYDHVYVNVYFYCVK